MMEDIRVVIGNHMEFTLTPEEFASEVCDGIVPGDLLHALDLLQVYGIPEAWGAAVDDMVVLEEV